MPLEGLNKDEFLKSWKALNGKIDDVYGLNLLKPLMTGRFLPFTASSMRPISIVHILNDITNNNRKRILEFGAGVSSILIARLLQLNNLNSSIISIDHNKDWLDGLDKCIKAESLDNYINFIHAPLSPSPLAIDDNEWYSTDVLDKVLPSEKFDVLIVDGPPAFLESTRYSRYPAIPYSYDKICSEAVIYIDDVNRSGERFIVHKWCKDYNYSLRIFNYSLGCLSKAIGGFGAEVFGNIPLK